MQAARDFQGLGTSKHTSPPSRQKIKTKGQEASSPEVQ